MNSDLLEKQRRWYQESFSEKGCTPEGMRLRNRENQLWRFQRIVDLVEPSLEEPSILDIGCGVGDLYGYLSKTLDTDIGEYLGLDIVPDMVKAVEDRYPEANAKVHDLSEKHLEKNFDYVLLSGTLNGLPDGISRHEWFDYSMELIKAMFEHTRYCMVINFLTAYNDYEEPYLMYFNPTEMFDFCHNKFTRHLQLDHSYGLYEACIAVYTKEAMSKRLKSPELMRYAE